MPAAHPAAAAHLPREHLPRDAALEHEEDAGQRGAILDRRTAAFRAWRTGRKQGAEEGPEGVGNEGRCHAPVGGKPMAALLPNKGSVRRSYWAHSARLHVLRCSATSSANDTA